MVLHWFTRTIHSRICNFHWRAICNKYKNTLENVTISMHCNLKPPYAAPVILRFNRDACAKFEVNQPIRCCLTFLLLTPYTLRCDFELWPWTFVMYRRSRDQSLYQMWVKSSNSRRSYSDFNIWPNGLEHFWPLNGTSWTQGSYVRHLLRECLCICVCLSRLNGSRYRNMLRTYHKMTYLVS